MTEALGLLQGWLILYSILHPGRELEQGLDSLYYGVGV